jgi:hypothetical protein
MISGWGVIVSIFSRSNLGHHDFPRTDYTDFTFSHVDYTSHTSTEQEKIISLWGENWLGSKFENKFAFTLVSVFTTSSSFL